MTMHIVSLLASFVVLVWAADRFVTGASRIALHWHISPLLIGLTVVALGTSAPEIIVAVTAAIKHQGGLAIGSALGSNIANVGLVLGVCALFSPIPVRRMTLKREYIVLLMASLLVLVLMLDGDLSRQDGFILLVVFIVFLCGVVAWALYSHRGERIKVAEPPDNLLRWAWVWLVVGCVTLPVAADFFVAHASSIAQAMGVSQVVIGLTMVAIGTSLPELAASLVGMYKGHHEIAIGNVIGSNVFNLLAVLPFPGLLDPAHLPPHVLSRDLPAVLISTLAIFFVGFAWRGDGRIQRWEGALLLISYGVYLVVVL